MPTVRATAKAPGSKAEDPGESEDPSVVPRKKEARARVPLESMNGQRAIGNGIQPMNGDLHHFVACARKREAKKITCQT